MKPACLCAVLLSLLLVLPTARPADGPDKKPDEKQRYEYRDKHDPDGIGKFYMKREIAHVMGFQAAGWLDRPEREKEEQTTKMIDALKLQPGEVIADLGAGSGAITFRLCEKVGPKGKVYAVDIQKEMIAILRERAKLKKIANIEIVQNTETDPKLPADTLDLILMVDVYHELSHPYEMTEALVKALKPGGRLVLVEFKMEDPDVPIKLVHKMSEVQVKKEMAPHPLKWEETIGTLSWQHVIVFKKEAKK
ncbi:MAG: class I SAM-dependent methyltransferase [Planctomycetia bacterium]|nr:class I SAM-dependent methyltransferase [Planctomycetia bacterium]